MTAAVLPTAMRPNVSDVYRRAVGLLEDGEWKDLEKVVQQCGKLIPPGTAAHHAERARRNKAHLEGHRNPDNRKRPLSADRLVAVGQRNIVMRILHNKLRFEMRTYKGRRQIRLKPRGD